MESGKRKEYARKLTRLFMTIEEELMGLE